MRSLPEFSVRNPVAVNLVMYFLIIVGGFYAFTLVREFFPPTDPEIIYVGMSYPGSTPEEVERGITKRLEDAIIDLEGIEKMTTSVVEGSTGIVVEVESGADKLKLLDEIQREVDRITDFPEEALEPFVIDIDFTVPVISVAIYGDAGERRLKMVADELEDDIRQRATVSAINRIGARNAELSASVDPARLEQFNLTFGEVARAIGRSNFDLPAGEIKAPGGSILVRTLGEKDAADRLREIVVRSAADGSRILLGDVATVADGFTERKQLAFYRGKPAVVLTIFKSREQDAIAISRIVRKLVAERDRDYPGESIRLEARADTTRLIAQRQNMLLRNGLSGLVLVFICLALFLDFRVAKWTAAGLPVSFMGTFIMMKLFGVTINMISLFGLIIVIGLIVDDAIVIGENIFRHFEEGMPPHKAAIEGAREVVWPVLLTVLTTIVAFAPLLFLKGVIGDFLGQLPLVVIAALSVSLMEAVLILPSHLAESLDKHQRRKHRPMRWRLFGAALGAPLLGGIGWFFGPAAAVAGVGVGATLGALLAGRFSGELEKGRSRFDRILVRKEEFFNRTLPNLYEWMLRAVLHWRYVFIACMIAVMMVSVGFVASGLLKYTFIQKTDSETIIVNIDMGAGAQAEETVAVLERVRAAAREFPEVDGMLSLVGVKFSEDGTRTGSVSESIGQVIVDLIGAEERDRAGMRSSEQFIADLRERVGEVPRAKSIRYESAQGGPPGADIELDVRHPDYDALQEASKEIADRLASYDGVADIENTLEIGKSEVRLRLLPAAEALGLTTRDLAEQVRGAFFGAEAQSLQRDREEVKVYARLSYDERRSLDALGKFRIKTPSGERVPLSEVASFELGRGYSRLTRIDGQRAVRIGADVNDAVANTSEIVEDLEPFLVALQRRLPGLNYEFSGEKKKTADAFSSLRWGGPMAMLGIFCMLAIMFHSYLQPLIIMSAIPFGIIGAIWGHPIMGYPITVLSIIGIVALSGIVVNDSLILVDFINSEVRSGAMTLMEAVVAGGRLRLRAILLTSLTTVFGLVPLMMERSFQAQFLIPMAISISFGLGFATVITLFIVPSLYLVLEDLHAAGNWLVRGRWESAAPIGMRRVKLQETIARSYED